jgi:choline kinase
VKVDYKWWGIDTPEDLERLKSALEKEEINDKR